MPEPSRLPRILLSNDDGIYAPGLMALYRALQGLGELRIVAPISERSAVGHAITIADPIKVRPVQREQAFSGYGVSGTPADCVKLAVCALLPEPPDLVVSGINLGPNAGISVIYSGTVSAATEGTILGIPSLAFSLATFTEPCWETAQAVARAVVREALIRKVPAGTLLNVNIPNRPLAELAGYRVTRMGASRFIEVFHERKDPAGNIYYWMDGELQEHGERQGSDLEALDAGYVTLTPIGLDLTQYAALPELQTWKPAWQPEDAHGSA